MKKKRKSILNDAIQYSKNDFQADLRFNDDHFEFEFNNKNDIMVTSDYNIVANYSKEKRMSIFEEDLKKSTWQGQLYKIE